MVQRIALDKQRTKIRSKTQVDELMSSVAWKDKQSIIDYIDQNINSLEDTKSFLKEMAAILILIKEAL